MQRIFRTFFCLLPLLATTQAAPKPGDIFREFTYGARFSELDLNSKRDSEQIAAMRANSRLERNLDVYDLKDATRAEVVVEYWGGHLGTSEQRFRVNGSDWFQLPQPQGTPTAPQCYYRTMLAATVEVPLAALKSGRNAFQFSAGPQICHGFDWGFYWVYAFTVRVYYGANKLHPTGALTAPVKDGVMGDNPQLTAMAHAEESTISRVEFIGEYDDFNWEGDGVWRQWHYIYQRGQMRQHLGTATAAPYTIKWDTTWVPDQTQPLKLAARITDSLGISYITPAVAVTLKRNDRSVKMYKAANVPENFGVRVKRRLSCGIDVPDDLKNARRAQLLVSTWSAAHADEIGFNEVKLVERVGVVHNYSFDALAVPLKLIKPGGNTFYLYSTTEHHAAEVNWPGPVLLVEYAKKSH